MSEPRHAIVVLAAGGSRRLGHAKQLVEFRGETLIARAVRVALEAAADHVIVVLGAHAAEVDAAIGERPVDRVHNPRWSSGQGTSIAAGVARARALAPDVCTGTIMLCDQPALEANHLRDLRAAWTEASDRSAIAATRLPSNSGGVPACFGSSHFDDLEALDGDRGARSLIARSVGPVALVDPPAGGLGDVDTAEDVRELAEDRFSG